MHKGVQRKVRGQPSPDPCRIGGGVVHAQEAARAVTAQLARAYVLCRYNAGLLCAHEGKCRTGAVA